MGSKPKTPTYNVVAPQLAQNTPSAMQVPVYNQQNAIDDQLRVNQAAGQQMYANVNSPLGGVSTSIDPVTGQITINKTLSDNSLRAQGAQAAALGVYTGDGTDAANAYYNAQMAYMQPQLDRQVQRAESSLTNRGLPLGSNAWNEVMGNVYDAQNRTLSSLSDNAIAAGQNYQTNILNQAALAGGQVVDPAMIGGQGGSGLGGGTYDNYYNSLYNQAAANYENALTRYNNEYTDAMNAYQNDLNKYQNQVQQYQTKMANRNSLLGGTVGLVGTIGGAALGGPIGASIGGMLGGQLGNTYAGAVTNNGMYGAYAG